MTRPSCRTNVEIKVKWYQKKEVERNENFESTGDLLLSYFKVETKALIPLFFGIPVRSTHGYGKAYACPQAKGHRKASERQAAPATGKVEGERAENKKIK